MRYEAAKVKCKECNRTKTKRNFSYRKTTCNKCYREGPSYAKERDRYLRNVYGITLAEYQILLEEQAGGCNICGGRSGGKNLAVDHDHKTGRVRGLLCKRHNTAIARWIRNLDEALGAVNHFSFGADNVDYRLGRRVVVPEQDN